MKCNRPFWNDIALKLEFFDSNKVYLVHYLKMLHIYGMLIKD